MNDVTANRAVQPEFRSPELPHSTKRTLSGPPVLGRLIALFQQRNPAWAKAGDRPVYRADEDVREESHCNRGRGGYEQREAHRWSGRDRLLAIGLAHEHGIGDLQVVVEANDGVEHRGRSQHVVARLDEAEEDEVLAVEA